MTKAQWIEKLKSVGEYHSDMASYTKAQLEQYYNDYKRASSMTMEELEEELRRRGLLK